MNDYEIALFLQLLIIICIWIKSIFLSFEILALENRIEILEFKEKLRGEEK